VSRRVHKPNVGAGRRRCLVAICARRSGHGSAPGRPAARLDRAGGVLCILPAAFASRDQVTSSYLGPITTVAAPIPQRTSAFSPAAATACPTGRPGDPLVRPPV
jgi:hypothetical protein